MSFYRTGNVSIRLHTTKLLKIEENGNNLAFCWRPDENSKKIKSIDLEGNIQKLTPAMKTSVFEGDIIIELSQGKLIASIREPSDKYMTEKSKKCYNTGATIDHWKPDDIKVPQSEHENLISKTLLYLSYHQLVDVVTDVHAIFGDIQRYDILGDMDGMSSVIRKLL